MPTMEPDRNNVRRYVPDDQQKNGIENYAQFKAEQKLFNSGPGAGKTLASHVVC